jgi:hypothetical protein
MTNDDGDDPRVVDASPTKDFFIEMLIKDLALVPAIIDLVDNSLDGARRIRQAKSYRGLWVRLTFNDRQFEIADNCGGIDVDTARNYAFRFGRAGDAPTTVHSIGQFGVGMKRALFKLGRIFEVTSTTRTSRFNVRVNVDEWRKDDRVWAFRFSDDPEENLKVPAEDTGTVISVRKLRDAVAEEFASSAFAGRLASDIERRHGRNLARGIEIQVNTRRLRFDPITLLNAQQLRPVYREFPLTSRQRNDVQVRLFAGLGEGGPLDAGWYVYCNDRLVLEADRTSLTGWGETGGDGTTIPRFHNQYADFRGYVFFDADDAGALPWNTTKTGVDEEHPVFRTTRLAMMQATRPVIDFLNDLKAEKEGAEEGAAPGPLDAALQKAKAVDVETLPKRSAFVWPVARRTKTPPDTQSIQYRRPVREIQRARKLLRVTTNREVGERTFEYFLKTHDES